MIRRAALGRAMLVAALVGLPVDAAAEGCPRTSAWVLVTFPESPPGGIDTAAIQERLRAELRARAITLCSRPPEVPVQPPLAVVRLSPASVSPTSVKLDIEVRDAVTAKRVGREIDLTSVPPDGRSAVVALAADELLRASWAELAIERARPPAVPLPPEVRKGLTRPPPPAPRPVRLALGLRGAAEWWSGGLDLYGADGAVAWRPAPRVTVELLLGARASPGASAPSGSIAARALAARIGGAFTLTDPKTPLSFGVALRAGGYLLDLEGRPGQNASGASATSGAMVLEAGPFGRLSLGARDAEVVLDAAFAGAVRGVDGRDGGAPVAGVSGVAGIVCLGLAAGIL
jgi:hypothetical protein